MTISRKMFSGRVTIPPNEATSLNILMRNSSLHWGLETDLTSPSMDSIIGSAFGVTPDGDIWIGSDANVKNTTVGTFYQGVLVPGGQNYSIQDFGQFGLVDPNLIWLYSVSGAGADVTFQAR